MLRTRFSGASLILLAGSAVRGEGTEFSDLDLVVVFPHLDHAWRESFRFGGWPVEAFVHDPETLQYFFEEVDRASGVPSLPRMVFEGIPIPDSAQLAGALKEAAHRLLVAGPPELEPQEVDERRYAVSDMIEDLRAPRSREELVASGCRLYAALGDLFLRSRKQWSASGKALPRAIAEEDPQTARAFARAFDALFTGAGPNVVIQLAERILQPLGGMLFDGFRRDAPATWRRAPAVPQPVR